MEQPGAASKAQPTDRNGLDSRRGTIRWHVVVLLAAGGALRIWPVFVLGHRFSGLVAIQPTTSWSERRPRRHPSPELSGAARQLAGMGARLSFGGRGIAHSAPYSAAPRAFVLKSGCCVRSL